MIHKILDFKEFRILWCIFLGKNSTVFCASCRGMEQNRLRWNLSQWGRIFLRHFSLKYINSLQSSFNDFHLQLCGILWMPMMLGPAVTGSSTLSGTTSVLKLTATQRPQQPSSKCLMWCYHTWPQVDPHISKVLWGPLFHQNSQGCPNLTTPCSRCKRIKHCHIFFRRMGFLTQFASDGPQELHWPQRDETRLETFWIFTPGFLHLSTMEHLFYS